MYIFSRLPSVGLRDPWRCLLLAHFKLWHMVAVVRWKTSVLLPISLPHHYTHCLSDICMHAPVWACVCVCCWFVVRTRLFRSKRVRTFFFFVSLNLLFVFSICPFYHVSAQSSSHCHRPYYCLFWRLPFFYREIPFSFILTILFVPLPHQAWGLNPANHLRSNRLDTRTSVTAKAPF